jgi:putative methionine-R-sulfoxide reductase with GAF domain
MAPRSLDSLAYALTAAHDLDSALLALADDLTEVERAAYLGLARHDARTGLLTEVLSPAGHRVDRSRIEVAFAHLPKGLAPKVGAGAEFADAGDQSREIAHLLGLRGQPDASHLALKGVLHDGELVAVILFQEARRIFGSRSVERIAPAVALFEVAMHRFLEREARDEAVRALEAVTRRVHGEYMAKLSQLETQLAEARDDATQADRAVEVERERARLAEDVRRAQQRARALEHQVAAGTSQLEQAHIELHRRNELLRQRTRTLYLIERTLTLAASSEDPKTLADGLLSLVGDDLQAQRCSLFLRTEEPNELFLAASRGLAPHVREGARITVGEGVTGRVAASREPILVVDTSDAPSFPLLADEHLTTGSFMCFPLVAHDELVGVINLTNRAQRGLFIDEDLERARLLGLICALAANETGLADRLLATTRG